MPFLTFSLSPSSLKFWPINSDRNAIKFVTKPTTSVTYASSNEDPQNFYNYIMRGFISWYRTIHPSNNYPIRVLSAPQILRAHTRSNNTRCTQETTLPMNAFCTVSLTYQMGSSVLFCSMTT